MSGQTTRFRTVVLVLLCVVSLLAAPATAVATPENPFGGDSTDSDSSRDGLEDALQGSDDDASTNSSGDGSDSGSDDDASTAEQDDGTTESGSEPTLSSDDSDSDSDSGDSMSDTDSGAESESDSESDETNSTDDSRLRSTLATTVNTTAESATDGTQEPTDCATAGWSSIDERTTDATEDESAALNDESTAVVLDVLSRLGGASVSELADELGRDPSTVTHHLQRLEEDDIVVREREGRAVINRLSAEARTALEPETETPARAEASGTVASD